MGDRMKDKRDFGVIRMMSGKDYYITENELIRTHDAIRKNRIYIDILNKMIIVKNIEAVETLV